MERLTERLTDKSYCISDLRAIRKEVFYEDMECRHGFDLYTGKAIDKLAEYEDLEEQGKLLKLPCAVGDRVWKITRRKEIINYIVRKILMDECGIFFIGEFCVCHITDFGKSAFITQEEAEAALKEMGE